MTKRIPLTRGKFALVSDEDFDTLSQYRWFFTGTYAARQGKRRKNKRTLIFMHRVIAKAPHGLQVDHINGDPLDNQRENLRICTHKENMMNRPGFGGASQYKGVCHDKRRDRWYARHGKQHIGSFDTEVKAAYAYDDYVRQIYGDTAWLNFPDTEQFDRAAWESARAEADNPVTLDVIRPEPRNHAATVLVHCDNCGKPMQRKEYYATRYEHNFCGKSCWASFANRNRGSRK